LRYLDFGAAAAFEYRGETFPQLRVAAIDSGTPPCGSMPVRPAEWMRQGGCRMALVIGLVSIAVIWLVVIYGSNYVNKNVQ